MTKTKPHIFIAYAGGTIGMEKRDGGYAPSPGMLEQWTRGDARFRSDEVSDFTIHECDPLLDSANMAPHNWLEIAEIIRDNYDRYDGFLVLHGTDTMAYTASALSFMLEGLGKPVILTGSQIPLTEARNDAAENLLTSLIILGRYHRRLAEVFVYFSGRLFRGNRVTKVDADRFDAFASPCYPTVAEAGVHIDIDFSLVTSPKKRAPALSLVAMGGATVAAFRLFPGIKARYLENSLAPPVQGVVLECYGAGNAPARDNELITTLARAVARSVVIVAVTQPPRGTADLDLYETGRALRDIGVVSGYDMTTEAALAKMFYLFEKGYPPAEATRLVGKNLRGELTLPHE